MKVLRHSSFVTVPSVLIVSCREPVAGSQSHSVPSQKRTPVAGHQVRRPLDKVAASRSTVSVWIDVDFGKRIWVLGGKGLGSIVSSELRRRRFIIFIISATGNRGPNATIWLRFWAWRRTSRIGWLRGRVCSLTLTLGHDLYIVSYKRYIDGLDDRHRCSMFFRKEVVSVHGLLSSDALVRVIVALSNVACNLSARSNFLT